MSNFYSKLKINNEATGNKVIKTDASGIIMEAEIDDSQVEKVEVLDVEGSGVNFLADDGTYKKGVDIVNDLTTGGTDKALSAEMGKGIKLQLDEIQGQVEEANDIIDDILGE